MSVGQDQGREAPVVEPRYRWVCTFCDTSDLAESPEMARLAIDVHVSVFHARARKPIRAQSEASGNILMDRGDAPTPQPSDQAMSDVPPDDRPPAQPPPAWRRWMRSWKRVARGWSGRQP